MSDRRITGYRPWLDGLRAVAIVLVVARHIGFGWASHAGGPAVALFFALSGYLITGLLLDERAKAGRVDMPGFYLRRAARLLPALVLMLAVCDVLYVLAGRPEAVKDSLYALFYVKNYHDAFVGSHGVYGQTWSLSVEEHFYLVWPVVLLGVLGRTRRQVAMYVALGLAAAALLWRGVLVTAHASSLWLYMGSAERADGLLIGCAAAIAVRRGWQVPRWVTVLSAVVFTMIVWPGGHPQTWEQSAGYTVQAVAGAGLVAGLDCAGSPGRALLSWRPAVWIGRLSYGIYLWHIAALDLIGPRLPGPWGRDVVAPLASVVVAELSFRFVETPVRRWAHRTRAERPDERRRRAAALRPLRVLVPAGDGPSRQRSKTP